MINKFILIPLFFLLISCHSNFETNQDFSSAGNAGSPQGQPATSPAIDQPNSQGLKVNMTFNLSTSSFLGGSMTLQVVAGAEYSVVVNGIGGLPFPGPLLFGIPEAADINSQIVSISLMNDTKNQLIESVSGPLAEGFFWRKGWTAKQCRGDLPNWNFPEPGNYRIVAAYKNGSSRALNFSMSDPCKNTMNYSVLTNAKNRVPASVIKKNKK